MHSSTAFRGRVLAEAEDNNLDGERWSSRWDRWYTCSLCEQQYHGAVRGAQAAVERDADTGLARQAQVVAERTFVRWHSCRLCEQDYHGVVRCALGWACWKTYVGRPEADEIRGCAMTTLGNGLYDANHMEDASSVKEAELSMLRRVGASEYDILATQGNLACTYQKLGRCEDAVNTFRDVYSGRLRLYGEEHEQSLISANNYAHTLLELRRFEEAKALLRRTLPVARRVLGESDTLKLTMRWNYARALSEDPAATLDDLREAVTTLEEIDRAARRVLGGAHPLTEDIGESLRASREKAMARGMSAIREAMAAMTPRGAQDDPSS